MGNCIFYRYKEGDYHCTKTNHDISDENHVRKYCWGSCESCPVFCGEEKADHHRGTDECIYYCFRNEDYYCQKSCQYLGKSTVDRYCWHYNYRDCPTYSDKKPDSDSSGDSNESSNDSSGGTSNSSSSSHSGGTSAVSGDYSVLSVLGAIASVILLALWKVIKTIPFWLPYAVILILPFMTMQAPVGTSSGGSVDGIFFLAYLVLHTIFLVRRKKWDFKYKNWPIYVAFLLLVVTLKAMGGAPAVAFQIGVLIWMYQQKKKAA